MIALYTIAVFVFFAYILVTALEFDCIPKSISDTYYLWAERNRGLFFTFFMWVCALCLLLPMLSVSANNTHWMAFLSCSGMMFVGCASAFKETLTKVVHYTSAIIWAVFAVAWTICNEQYMAIAVALLIGVILYLHARMCFTFFAECTCALMLIIAVMMLLV